MEHLLILVSTSTGCVSISASASLVGISIRITSSTTGLKACAITPRIKKYYKKEEQILKNSIFNKR